jgi:hypothetical protein
MGRTNSMPPKRVVRGVQTAVDQHPLIEVHVSREALRLALGPEGSPATLAFTFNAVTVSTPSRTVRVPARTLVSPLGVHTAGLRPPDADVLRDAATGTDRTVSLIAHALTLTLVDGPTSVTFGRW